MTAIDALGLQIADAIELRILRNVIGMLADGVAADQIAGYLELDVELLQRWAEDELPGQVRAWLQALNAKR